MFFKNFAYFAMAFNEHILMAASEFIINPHVSRAACLQKWYPFVVKLFLNKVCLSHASRGGLNWLYEWVSPVI